MIVCSDIIITWYGWVTVPSLQDSSAGWMWGSMCGFLFLHHLLNKSSTFLRSQAEETETWISAVAVWRKSNQHKLQQHYCFPLSQSPGASRAFHKTYNSLSHTHTSRSACQSLTHWLVQTSIPNLLNDWLFIMLTEQAMRQIREFAGRRNGTGTRIKKMYSSYIKQ